MRTNSFLKQASHGIIADLHRSALRYCSKLPMVRRGLSHDIAQGASLG